MALVTIILAMLACISLAGGYWLFSAYIAQVVASLAIGRLALQSPDRGTALAAFAAGLVIFAVLCSIPYAYVGTVVAWVGMLLALGALLLCLFGLRRRPETAMEGKPVLPPA